jgi:hypothetical protein
VKIYGEEVELYRYSGLTIEQFLQELSSMTGIEANKVSLKHIDEISIKRIDFHLYGPEDMTKLSTLFTMKIRDMANMLVEVKDENEVFKEE